MPKIEDKVKTALDNAERKDYPMRDCTVFEIAEDLVRYDAGLKNYQPEQLVPFVQDWLDKRGTTPMLAESVWDGAGERMAIIVRRNYHGSGVVFFTDPSLGQQLAYIAHPAGKEIQPHVHNDLPRAVSTTQEVLIIRRGKLRVDFFNALNQYLESRLLEEGDVILLIKGGHGFHVVKDVEMIEVKQGPYLGEALDKTRFDPTSLTVDRSHEYDPH